MTDILKMVQWIATEGPVIVSAVVGVLTALIGLCMLIPGEQPEKALQKIVDLIARFSKK